MNKTFTIDFDSIESCKRLQNTLNSRIGELQCRDPGYLSKNDRIKMVFESCISIFETDISHLYDISKYDLERKYYVYAHCDPGFRISPKREGRSTFAATLGFSNMPFYIGKGCDNRAYDLNRNESHRKYRQKIQKFGKDIEVKILKENLSELEALMIESKLTDIFGTLSCGGRLVNLDEGINSKERQDLYRIYLEKINKVYKNSVGN
jgi:hypothetical protein